MISGPRPRRGRALFWSTLASAVVHVIVLTALFYAVARLFVPRGEKETVSQTTAVTISRAIRATPAPAHPHAARAARPVESVPAQVPHPELAKRVAFAATPEPLQRRPSLPSRIERDEAGFAKEVARLNAESDPHAIPTIDPGAREASTKQYAFDIPAQLRGGEEHGNGIITPTRRWTDSGRDCYYGHYEFTYPDGAEESGEIVWPFCYDPGDDPFRLPPHEIPFPLPLPGYRLPPDTQLPPIEKSVYQQWIANQGSAP